MGERNTVKEELGSRAPSIGRGTHGAYITLPDGYCRQKCYRGKEERNRHCTYISHCRNLNDAIGCPTNGLMCLLKNAIVGTLRLFQVILPFWQSFNMISFDTCV